MYCPLLPSLFGMPQLTVAKTGSGKGIGTGLKGKEETGETEIRNILAICHHPVAIPAQLMPLQQPQGQGLGQYTMQVAAVQLRGGPAMMI
jgi:hypothetical protein